MTLKKDYNGKLSDFGLAKDGPGGEETHATTRIMWTQGYAGPEYIMTDNSRPSREQSLVEWARPLLRDPKKLDRPIDARFEGQIPNKWAQKVSALAYKCLNHQPKLRPNMGGDMVKICLRSAG
ncbi:hypothetical protein V6N13_095027 [Hibiscus sabdariffa]|uniref:Protein kinase domain-containing protein n=1 Tax=Hibiscus sabdariffa TaxID=183260 RepID=A0ABR2PSX2_9ROSI